MSRPGQDRRRRTGARRRKGQKQIGWDTEEMQGSWGIWPAAAARMAEVVASGGSSQSVTRFRGLNSAFAEGRSNRYGLNEADLDGRASPASYSVLADFTHL